MGSKKKSRSEKGRSASEDRKKSSRREAEESSRRKERRHSASRVDKHYLMDHLALRTESKHGRGDEERHSKKQKPGTSGESPEEDLQRHRSKKRSREREHHKSRGDVPPRHEDDEDGDDRDSRFWREESDSHSVRANSDTYWNKYGDKFRIRYGGDSNKEGSHSEPRRDSRSYDRGDGSLSRESGPSDRGARPSAENKENFRKGNKRKVDADEDGPSGTKRTKAVDERTHREGEPSGKPSGERDSNAGVANTQRKNNALDMLTTRTGGAYIPPARLKLMQQQITDKSSAAYQRIAWEALKKSIHGLINKINTSNIAIIVQELFKEDIVRGRGLLCRSIIQAQAASPTFTHVYAALSSIINSKFPNIGELLLRRLVIQFRKGFRRNDKNSCLSGSVFIAHLVNQQVAHEILALEILTLLLERPTDDSVEVAIAFLKECGMKLMEVSRRGINAIFETLRSILHESQVDKRVQYMIEVIFQVRKDGFKDHPVVLEELDLVDEKDQFTHLITLDEATDSEDILNVFKHDPEYEAHEQKYKELRKEILDESTSGSEGGSGSGSEGSGSDESENEEAREDVIIDNTETNLVALRRLIYLTIQSSLDFEECAHKLMKMELKPGQEIELCHMILDCCAQQRTYEKFFGLLAQRFCQINKTYIEPFQAIFKDSYDTIHRLDTNKLRNVAKFFAHLLYTDAVSWEVLFHIKLNEEDTTSSSRIFIKILFQELSEHMGLPKLNERVKDPTLQLAFDGLFPRDNPKNTRFAINFFTSIGLGGLTDELREHLKNQPKTPVVPTLVQALPSDSSDDESSSSSEESSDSSSDTQHSTKPTKKGKKKSKRKEKKKKKKRKKKKNR